MKKFNNDKRNYLILGLCLVVLIMAVGFAAFATRLNVSGTAEINSVWNIQITDISVKEKVGNASNDEKVTSYNNENGLTATFKANLLSPSDSITYDVTIKNFGTLDAVLEKITKSIENESDVIIFEISGVEENDVLKVGATTHLYVKITFKDIAEGQGQPTITASDLKVMLNYTQYVGTSGTDKPSPIDTNYYIGDFITLKDNTNWVVVEDSLSDNEFVRIMSLDNIAPNLTTSNENLGTALFKSNDYAKAFDTKSGSEYDDSTIKVYLENIVQPLLAKRLDIDSANSLNIGMWGNEEMTNLGCTIDLDTFIVVQPLANSIICDSSKAWYQKVFQSTNSWINLAWDSTDMWYIESSGNLQHSISNNADSYGVRPIITIPKDKIQV